MIPVNIGRLFGPAEKAIMVYVPEPMPPGPRPSMARHTMSAVLLGATPQMREPSSKMNMEMRKLTFSGKYL
jgi:hypothetical protein